MPATVTVNNNHSHLLLNAEALSFRKTDPVTRSKFEDYFEQGMTAAAAAEFHSNRLDLDPDCDGGSLAKHCCSIYDEHKQCNIHTFLLCRQSTLLKCVMIFWDL